jgi:hypothetical protein
LLGRLAGRVQLVASQLSQREQLKRKKTGNISTRFLVQAKDDNSLYIKKMQRRSGKSFRDSRKKNCRFISPSRLVGPFRAYYITSNVTIHLWRFSANRATEGQVVLPSYESVHFPGKNCRGALFPFFDSFDNLEIIRAVRLVY